MLLQPEDVLFSGSLKGWMRRSFAAMSLSPVHHVMSIVGVCNIQAVGCDKVSGDLLPVRLQ
jgi:hypothetical protein